MLRVIDAGTVSARRSQGLWHGIASAMDDVAAPVLSVCRPAEHYVCLGYHRRLDEIDGEACRRDAIPILRRQIGGGPVWIDADQLFFQITMPWRRAPVRVDDIYARLLGPAVQAFRGLGLDASLRGLNDIAVADRKISGTGAGRIGDAVTVVGNLLFRFPHERMVSVLAVPARTRAECLRLMRRHVSSLEAEGIAAPSFEAMTRALVDAYARGLGLSPVASELSAAEATAIAAWEARVADPRWVAGPMLPCRASSQVKICADVFVLTAAAEGISVEASIVDGRIDRVRVEGSEVNGAAARIERAALGQAIAALPEALAAFGPPGARLLELFRDARRMA